MDTPDNNNNVLLASSCTKDCKMDATDTSQSSSTAAAGPPAAADTDQAHKTSSDDNIDDTKLSATSNAPLPTQNNAWDKATKGSTPLSQPNKSNEKKRSNSTFADIMAEQESEKNITTSKAKVNFCHEVESEEERMMRIAIEASLQDQQNGTSSSTDYFISHAIKMPPSALKQNLGGKHEKSHSITFSDNPTTCDVNDNNGDDMDEDMKMAIALSLQETGGNNNNYANITDDTTNGGKSEDTVEDDRKPSALPKQDSASTAAESTSSKLPTGDESERLAQALYQAELDEQTGNAAAEAASLQLALQLQEQEDARNNIDRNVQLKREEMCHGGGAGVRTVSRDEFHSLKNDKAYGGDGGNMVDRRKHEERGMGKLLSSKNCYNDDEEDTTNFMSGENQADDINEYYYYAKDRYKQDDDIDEEDIDDGIRMNSHSSSSSGWKRLDKDTFLGPNNEIRTKHDPDLKRRSNAVQLLGSHGAKLKDAKSASVSDKAYNSFKRAESRQSGMKKGVSRQGHGRAEVAGKTRGGAMDDNVRLQISNAINAGFIQNCHGVVKEGKEALLYHADAGLIQGDHININEKDMVPDGSIESIRSDGYDVAVKVFKRIVEFKGRDKYVDGDPRYHKQKFNTNDQRNQVVIWANKEYRNLIRAHRAGITVPQPLYQKENIIFQRFLGESGWPSPQLREVEIKKGSSKWTAFYCQVSYVW